MTKETINEIIEDIATNGSLEYEYIILTVTLKDNTSYTAVLKNDFDAFIWPIGDSLRLTICPEHDIYIDIDTIKCISSTVTQNLI